MRSRSTEKTPRSRRGWFRFLCPALPLVALLAGCAASVPEGGIGAEADFQRGKQLFEDRRYLQAVQVLETFRNEHPGSDLVDDAIFLLGKAHQKLDENLLAREEFDRLLRDFPQSELREEAQFERAMSWMEDSRPPALDAEPTRSALEAFRTYLRNYPNGAHVEEAETHIRVCLDRLAVKAFMNGETYLRLRQPHAARIYFEKSLSILSDFSRAGDAMLGLARAAEMLGEEEQARAAYTQLMNYATPERAQNDKHLRELRARAEEALSRSPTARRNS